MADHGSVGTRNHRRTGKGNTERRSFRIEDEIWLPAIARAKRDDASLSGLVRQWLADYGSEREESE